jgi:hypothetical protein
MIRGSLWTSMCALCRGSAAADNVNRVGAGRIARRERPVHCRHDPRAALVERAASAQRHGDDAAIIGDLVEHLLEV